MNQVTARRYGLWSVKSPVATGQNVFRVDGKANVPGPYRMSTRISTKKNYNGGGLFVFDVRPKLSILLLSEKVKNLLI